MEINVLCAGAAQGLLNALKPVFTASTGTVVHSQFGAVGALREKLLGGEPCDVIILTATMLAELEARGRVLPGTSAPLGRVRTGIAVRVGDPLPRIADRQQLRTTLLDSSGIYVPDTQRSTAGMHFADVVRQLGIVEDLATRLRSHPNGATAMRELAQTKESGLVGCTQITEIKYTPGVLLVGPLPTEFELATVYTAAVCVDTRKPDLARGLTQLLSAPATQELRVSCGFE